MDVGDDIDDDRAIRHERFVERASQLARIRDANAACPNLLGNARKAHVALNPQLFGFLGRIAVICPGKSSPALVAGMIVIDDRDRIDIAANRRFQVSNVIPHAEIASERDDRAIWGSTLRA